MYVYIAYIQKMIYIYNNNNNNNINKIYIYIYVDAYVFANTEWIHIILFLYLLNIYIKFISYIIWCFFSCCMIHSASHAPMDFAIGGGYVQPHRSPREATINCAHL